MDGSAFNSQTLVVGYLVLRSCGLLSTKSEHLPLPRCGTSHHQKRKANGNAVGLLLECVPMLVRAQVLARCWTMPVKSAVQQLASTAIMRATGLASVVGVWYSKGKSCCLVNQVNLFFSRPPARTLTPSSIQVVGSGTDMGVRLGTSCAVQDEPVQVKRVVSPLKRVPFSN